MPTVIDVQRAEDPRDIVHRAVQALAERECIALPSETVYGLAASALSEAGVARMMELKGVGASERSKDQCVIAVAVKNTGVA